MFHVQRVHRAATLASNILGNVLDRSRSRLSARNVLVVLADEAGSKSACAWPSKSEIMRRANLSDSSVDRAILELVELGEVVVIPPGGLHSRAAEELGKFGQSNLYFLRVAFPKPDDADRFLDYLRGSSLTPHPRPTWTPHPAHPANLTPPNLAGSGVQVDPLILDPKRSEERSGSGDPEAATGARALRTITPEPLSWLQFKRAVAERQIVRLLYKGTQREAQISDDGRAVILTHMSSGHQIRVESGTQLQDVEILA